MRNHTLLGVVATLLTAGALDARPLATLSLQPVSAAGIAMVQDPLDPSVQYFVNKSGRVTVLKDGAPLQQAFADLGSTGLNIVDSRGSEDGLLGMAFASDYATSRRVYFFFTSNGRDANGAPWIPGGAIIIARFKTAPTNPLVIDPSTRLDLALTSATERYIPGGSRLHNGGTLNVGPDGYLYAGVGDGSATSGGPGNPAQIPSSLFGKMLRLDVNVPDEDPEGFDIPPSNPFAPGANAPIAANPLIWAFGLRNPWKFSFDDYGHGRTGALIIGDVGESFWEEINYQPAGVGGFNYGWSRYEGNGLYFSNPDSIAYDLGAESNYRYVAPVLAYPHHLFARCVIGGYVYRGRDMCSYKGRYFFADLGNRVWSMRLDGGVASDLLEHPSLEAGNNQVAFGRDAAGELYVIRANSVFKIVSDDPPMHGDADGDRDVDFVDLNAVLSQYGESGPAGGASPLAGDVNDDGQVDFIDLNIVLGSYGSVC